MILSQDVKGWTNLSSAATPSSYQLLGPVGRQESCPVASKSSHHSNDEPPPLPRRRAAVADKVESSNELSATPPMLPPRSHGNLNISRPRSIVGSTGLNYIHMQFSSDGTPPPRGRTHTTYSELVREVSGDPAPADKVLGRSSSEDDLSGNNQRVSTHEQHLDNVDLLRMNILKNGGSRSNPDVTGDSLQLVTTDDLPPPLPVRNKPLPTEGSHDLPTSESHDHNPFDQADPFESGKDVFDPSDFYQTPRSTLMVANGEDGTTEQQPVNEGRPEVTERVTMSTTSSVPSGYEESTLWANVDDDVEYQSPVIPYHDEYDVPRRRNPNNQHDQVNDDIKVKPNNQHDQDDDDEGEEYINPEAFGDHGNDDLQVTAEEVEQIISVGSSGHSALHKTSSIADEYSYPTELLGMSTMLSDIPLRATETVLPPRATETTLPPRATETVLPPRATETVLPPRATETIIPPRGTSSNDQHMSHSRPLPPIPPTHPTPVARQEPPLPARTSCVPKANSLGRTMSSLPRQQPRYDRESWIMRYVQQGYSRDQVVRALAITQNDFNMASNILKEFVKMRY